MNIAKYSLIALILFLILILIIYIVKNNNKEEEIVYDYLLQKYHLSLIKIQNVNYNNYEELNTASSYFKYIERIYNVIDYSILSNIINNSELASDNNDIYNKMNIAKNICMTLYLTNDINNDIVIESFELFKKWKINSEYLNNELIYSNAFIYIIMYNINEKYNLNIEFDINEYNEYLLKFNTDPIILSCKTLNTIPGIYSDGSYTYNTPISMSPGSLIEGSVILDIIIFAKYIMNIRVSDELIKNYSEIVIKELNYYGSFFDTLSYKLYSRTYSSYIIQIIFQLSYIYPDILSSIVDSKYLSNKIIIYADSINNSNIFPTLVNELKYLKNDISRFDIHTVNGTMRVIKNGFGITSSNYSSFCYTDYPYNVNDRYNIKFCIRISNPDMNNYDIVYANNVMVNIQNFFNNSGPELVMGKDHASVGYILNEDELFVSKAYTAINLRIQSYEILTYNSIISVNHITSTDLISGGDFIIFIYRRSSYIFYNDNKELHIGDYKIYCSHRMSAYSPVNNYIVIFVNFISDVSHSEDIVISFSINISLDNIILRPDENTICNGLMTIKEKRENEYMDKYSYIPENFDPLGIHYFELDIYELNLGFVLYGPFDDVVTKINKKDVIVTDNGVRYIFL